MSSYNYQKKADRNEARKAAEGELAATKDGSWPRDINDQMRWIRLPMSDSYESKATPAQLAYIAKMCKMELSYLDDVERRIAEGDPDLASYEG